MRILFINLIDITKAFEHKKKKKLHIYDTSWRNHCQQIKKKIRIEKNSVLNLKVPSSKLHIMSEKVIRLVLKHSPLPISWLVATIPVYRRNACLLTAALYNSETFDLLAAKILMESDCGSVRTNMHIWGCSE